MEKCVLFQFRCLRLVNVLNQRTLFANKVLFRSNSTLEEPKVKPANGTSLNVTNAKKKLDSLIREVAFQYQNDVCQPKFSTQRVGSGSKQWKTILSLGWPKNFVVEGLASNKVESEKLAALQAFYKLKEYGVLDENNSLALRAENTKLTEDNVRQAKVDLSNIFSMVCQKYGSSNWRPQVQYAPVKGPANEKVGWKATLSLKWPKNFTAEGVGRVKLNAERVAAYKALEWLRSQGAIDDKNFPILYTENEKSTYIASRRDPLPISFPKSFEQSMSRILQEFERIRGDIESGITQPKRYNSQILDSLVDKNEDFDAGETDELMNSSNPHENYQNVEMNVDEKKRSEYLYNSYTNRTSSNNIEAMKIKEMQESLPILDKKEEILNLIRKNQVMVLSGEPGCGKTTQVPQFILDEFSSNKKGGICNIVVTQPRRLSTINIAKIVSKQRLENVGETIGYQVRLQSVHPPRNGSILFCSTGVLLQKLHSDPDLLNYSHVIVDEVHERDVQTDFLLVLLKDIIQRNKTLKVALMSASLNAEMFSKYFNGCPIINVPGFMYPVQERYLPDILRNLSRGSQYNNELRFAPGKEFPRLNTDLVVDTIQYIDKTQPIGAILCFLPGWQDIKAVQKRLLHIFGHSNEHLICTVHSTIPHNEQELIFDNPPPGVRKIILSTNITETSITIDDVVYVIDPGFHKALSYDPAKGVARLGVEWISRANAKQRKGRAGRVKPGVCYRLYTKEAHKSMEEFPIPDMMRTPLEKVVIDSKIFCPDMLCRELLAKAPQPPSRNAVTRAVMDMTQLGVFDKHENLTLLGEKIAVFSTHPRLAVALVFSSFLKCVDTMLNIVSLLSAGRDPFHATLDQKSQVKEVKKKFDITKSMSDHLTLATLFEAWQYANEYDEEYKFIRSNMVSRSAVNFSSGLKKIFLNHLGEVGILNTKRYNEDDSVFEKFNINSPNWAEPNSNSIALVLATLCSSFYPNLVRIYEGSWGKSGIKSNSIVPTNIDDQLVNFTKESLVSKEIKIPHPWILYFHSMRSEERKQLMVKDSSPVSSLLVFLTAPNTDVHVSKVYSNEDDGEQNIDSEPKVRLMMDQRRKLSFTCTEREAELLMRWRECFFVLFQYFLSQNNYERQFGHSKKEIEHFIEKFVEEFGVILGSSSSTRAK